MEGEWLLCSFCFGNASLLIFDSSNFFILENLLVKRLLGGLRYIICLESDFALSLLSHLAFCFLLLQSLLANRFLVLVLQKPGRVRHSDVVFALASFGDEIHLANHLFLKLSHQLELLMFWIF